MLFEKRGDRVGAEAAALAAARHPGVVELADVDVDAGVLRTQRLEGARPLAEAGPLTAAEIAGVLASVAATLADLHDRGVVHGGIDAGHVLLAADGRPVLCSFGREGDRPGDVAAMGRLVARLLASARPDDQRRPGRGLLATGCWGRQGARGGAGRRPGWAGLRQWWRWRGVASPGAVTSAAGEGGARRPLVGTGSGVGGLRLRRTRRLGPMLAPPAAAVLAELAAKAVAADPDDRPTAQALATAVRDGVPTARWPAPAARAVLPLCLPRPAGTGTRWHRRSGRRPRPSTPRGVRPAGIVMAAVAGNVALAAVIVVLTRALADHGGASSPPPGDAPATRKDGRPPGPGATTTSGPVAVRVWPPEPLDFHDGVLSLDGVRYAVGRPGDAAVAGDWACTGRRTLALLRPATGEVFAFDGWPAGDEELVARLLGTVAGARGLRALDADGDGCDDLEVERPDGPPVVVEVAA